MLELQAFKGALNVVCASWPHWLRADAARVVESIGSTNTALLALASAADRPMRVALAARHQTAGRGRHQRKWIGQARASLALSIGMELALPISELNGITLVMGLAVRTALADCDAHVAVKWPNDLVDPKDRRKLGGLLVETQRLDAESSWVVVGIGLNLLSLDAHAALKATDLTAVTRADIDINVLAARIVGAVEASTQRFCSEGFVPFAAEFNAAHAFHGLDVELRHHDQVIGRGRFHGVSARGEVVLRDERGELHRYVSGELSLRESATA